MVRRSVEATIARAWQRAIGTAAGVLVGSLVLSAFTSALLLVPAVGLLAAVRPVLQVRNYTFYSVAMTPLIVILLEFGATPLSGVLLYRLADAGIGFLIAVVPGALPWPSPPGGGVTGTPPPPHRSSRALIATITVEALISTAPAAGVSTIPAPESTPAARGMATTL